MSPTGVSVKRFTFRKSEHLISRKIIEEVVANGNEIRESAFRMVWKKIVLPSASPAQIAFSVPKKIFKNATDRNLIRRRMREAWRKNKDQLYPFLQQQSMQYALIFMFFGKRIPDILETEQKLNLIIKKLVEDSEKNII